MLRPLSFFAINLNIKFLFMNGKVICETERKTDFASV